MFIVDPSDRFDQSTETGGRFTFVVNFDISDVLNDESMYAELAASLALTTLKQSVHVRACELVDHREERY